MSMGEEEVAGKLPGIRTKSRGEPRRLAPKGGDRPANGEPSANPQRRSNGGEEVVCV